MYIPSINEDLAWLMGIMAGAERSTPENAEERVVIVAIDRLRTTLRGVGVSR